MADLTDDVSAIGLSEAYSTRKVIAVIVGYFDDSNTHKGSRILSLCGFLADPRWREDFDVEWKKILDKPDWPNRPREFHTYDIVHRTGEFANWSLAQRLAFYGDMTGLLAECNILALGSICHIDAYENRTDEEKELLAKGGLFAPIDFTLQFLISQAIVSTRKYGQMHNPPVEFEEWALVFDEPSNKATEQRFLGIFSHLGAKHRTVECLLALRSRRAIASPRFRLPTCSRTPPVIGT